MTRGVIVAIRLLTVLCFVLAASPDVGAQSSTPLLRIETGGHIGHTHAAATDAAGRVLVTVGNDKTARIWSLPDLQPMGVLRPQIGENEDGFLYAVAVSPDGRFAAVGGWLGANARDGILLFDLQTRQVVRRLANMPDVVLALALSADGKRLAVGLAAGGLRVYAVSDGQLLTEDRDNRSRVVSVSFAPDGRLATASTDGMFRLYDAGGRRLRQMQGEAGRVPTSIRFSPDGASLAIGFRAMAVEVRSGSTLALQFMPSTAGLPRQDQSVDISLLTAEWSRDGRTLYAGGSFMQGERTSWVAWAGSGRGPRRALQGFENGLMDMQALPEGRMVVLSPAGEIAVTDSADIRLAEHAQSSGDLANMPGRFEVPARRLRLSRDGRTVEWVFYTAQDRWLRFQVEGVALDVEQRPTAGMTDWSASGPGLSVANWDYGSSPTLNGQRLPIDQDDMTFSASVGSGGALLGSRDNLYFFASATRRFWKRALPASAYRVNQSPDGQLVVAALGDGTIRWYRAVDGAELLALFVTPDAQRWVAFTPSGYYAASPGGEELIGWHINRGPDRAGDFFAASQFRDRFYRPDVVERVLTTLDEAKALRVADSARGSTSRSAVGRTASSPDTLRDDLPPVVTLLAPRDGAEASGGSVEVEYSIRSPSGRPVRSLRVLLDGRPAIDDSGRARVAEILPAANAAGEIRGRIAVLLSASTGDAREVTLSLLAETESRASEPARLRLMRPVPPIPVAAPAPSVPTAAPTPGAAPVPPVPNAMLPRLNAVLVGISDYPSAEHRLALAAKDARDLAAVLEGQRDRGLYGEINIRLVTDGEATRSGILRALEWLRRETTSNDVAIVFLAGHGLVEEGDTFFLPVDGDPDLLFATAVSQTDLQGTLRRVPGRVIAFVDICHAAAAVMAQGPGTGTLIRGVRRRPDMTAFVNQLREPGSGLIVFAGATARQPALEISSLGNGVFTASLVEGLRGAADLNRDGAVRTDELNVFVANRVRDLTGGRQHPLMQRPADVPDFPFAAVLR